MHGIGGDRVSTGLHHNLGVIVAEIRTPTLTPTLHSGGISTSTYYLQVRKGVDTSGSLPYLHIICISLERSAYPLFVYGRYAYMLSRDLNLRNAEKRILGELYLHMRNFSENGRDNLQTPFDLACFRI